MGFEGSPNSHLGKANLPRHFVPTKLRKDTESLSTLGLGNQGQKRSSPESQTSIEIRDENSINPKSKIKGMAHAASAIAKMPGVLPNEAETLRETDDNIAINRYSLIVLMFLWNNLIFKNKADVSYKLLVFTFIP